MNSSKVISPSPSESNNPDILAISSSCTMHENDVSSSRSKFSSSCHAITISIRQSRPLARILLQHYKNKTKRPEHESLQAIHKQSLTPISISSDRSPDKKKPQSPPQREHMHSERIFVCVCESKITKVGAQIHSASDHRMTIQKLFRKNRMVAARKYDTHKDTCVHARTRAFAPNIMHMSSAQSPTP